jgi:predicted nucleic acid-binding protein
MTQRLVAGDHFAVAEINDYETRRELLRKNALAQVGRLDRFIARSEFIPIDRDTMVYAAELWAHLRNLGIPTAADAALDGDVILGAQALLRSRRPGGTQVVVATENTRHLQLICSAPPCTAMDWTTIA